MIIETAIVAHPHIEAESRVRTNEAAAADFHSAKD